MRAILSEWPVRAVAGMSWLLGGVALAAAAPDLGTTLAVTNLAQVQELASDDSGASYRIRLEGDVWWVDSMAGRLVLKDATIAQELIVEVPGLSVACRDRVRLEGNGTIARRGAAFRIGARGPVVDNDGVHSMEEKSGSVYLKAGRNPICVDWFNGVEKSGLEVQYEGPGIARQRIPDAALYRQAEPGGAGGGGAIHGLDYRTYEVPGEVLPDFDKLPSSSSGVVSNFDLTVVGHPEHVGVRFRGWIEAPRDGLYVFHVKSDDGSRVYAGEPTLRLTRIGHCTLPEPERIIIGQPMPERAREPWVEVEGNVTMLRRDQQETELELGGGSGRLRVELPGGTAAPTGLGLNARLRAAGFCQSAVTPDGERVPGILLVPSAAEMRLIPAPGEAIEEAGTASNSLPLLTTAAEVHRLRREQAERAYPVRIRGVVTSVLPERQAFVLEDATRGLYVEDHSPTRSSPPQIGEFLEVEGVSDPSLFAPIVHGRQLRRLGAGRMPDPVVPAWDQLMNGSLDAQYVEVQGIVTAVFTNRIALRTRGGVVNVELRLRGDAPRDLRRYENALVRVRGCLLASWDYATHEVEVGTVRIYDADILVDQAAPADLFSSLSKTPAELLLFDPQAGEFERVKVRGQVVYMRAPEYFLTQGGAGLRFALKSPADLQVGDLVEVVGFPELLGSGYPILRDGVARKTGHAPLPAARALQPDELMQAGHDATRVRVEGTLAGVRRSRTDQVMEIQAGLRTFAARLIGDSDSLQSLAPGSRLELAGVYAGQGGNRVSGQEVSSFELLLNSPLDVTVLARPPWWTLERLLVIVGALAVVLAATMLWISQLHRQVEERSAEVSTQIRERQRVEHQRAMEQERTRIAQDLHDELGSGITEISMLAARMKAAAAPDERNHRYLDQVGDKAREMVTALDEIVWAMNPRHDSLASLVSYFSLYADRFLGLANIAWRLDGPAGHPDCVLDSRHRHQLFLAYKEALTNIVRHSGASEVRLRIQAGQGQVHLTIADNGRGLPPGSRTEEMDGVANMRARLEKLGGRFEVASRAGQGTLVQLWVPTT